MKKICVLGSFDEKSAFDGQTIKTLEIVNSLCKKYGDDRVMKISYHNIKNSKLKLLSAVYRGFSLCENVVIISRHASIGTLVKICTLINRFFKRPIYQIMIGGLLPDAVKEKPSLKNVLKKLNYVFVESEVQKSNLEIQGVSNAVCMPNFKDMRLYTEAELKKDFTKPYPLVFMSRVTEVKGIGELIEAVREINRNEVKFTLDIYGMIDEDYSDTFSKLKSEFPEYIRYCGICEPHKTSEVLHNYFLHVLPTRNPTEGQPGSVIDAFYAGVPTLCAVWTYSADMIPEGVCGESFPKGDYEKMKQMLLAYYDNPDRVYSMQERALKEAEKYSPEAIMNILYEKADDFR